jgi:hypothetical protein
MSLAVEKEAKVPVMLFAGMGLVRLLRGGDPVLSANARDALTNAAEHLEVGLSIYNVCAAPPPPYTLTAEHRHQWPPSSTAEYHAISFQMWLSPSRFALNRHAALLKCFSP